MQACNVHIGIEFKAQQPDKAGTQQRAWKLALPIFSYMNLSDIIFDFKKYTSLS